MFYGAKSFTRTLCGVAWVDSQATQFQMFTGSSGSICKKATMFVPQSRAELISAINTCPKSPKGDKKGDKKGDCKKGPHGPIDKWDVSSVKFMREAFRDKISFNADISKWDVSRVSGMYAMFYGAVSFNKDISKWDVSKARNMRQMFYGAESFNVDISKWDVSQVRDMFWMFYGAKSFTRTLCGTAWVKSKAGKTTIFIGSSGSICTTTHKQSALKSRPELTQAIQTCLKVSPKGDCFTGPNGPIEKWDVSSVDNMREAFRDAKSFNADISKWDVSRVADMREIFSEARSFNADISKWDVSRVINMREVFRDAILFNTDISKWDVSRVTIMRETFRSAKLFNVDISKWDVSSVTSLREAFRDAISFNADISKWDVSGVKNMIGVFIGATAFTRTLCGAAWVNSQSIRNNMFEGSSGSISACTTVSTAASTIGLIRLDERIHDVTATTTSPSVQMSTCPPGSKRTTECVPCGSSAVYCIDGVAKAVSPGYYTTGGTPTTRTGQLTCGGNDFYCVEGIRKQVLSTQFTIGGTILTRTGVKPCNDIVNCASAETCTSSNNEQCSQCQESYALIKGDNGNPDQCALRNDCAMISGFDFIHTTLHALHPWPLHHPHWHSHRVQR